LRTCQSDRPSPDSFYGSSGVKTRNNVAEVSLVELGIFADLAGEEALAQRAEWNESDAEFLECRYDFGLRFSPPSEYSLWSAVTGLNFMRADGMVFTPAFRKAEVL